MAEWEKLSTGNYVRNLNLTIRTSAQTGIRPGEWDAQSSLGFWETNRSSNLGQTIRPSDSQQKKKKKEEKKERKKENLSNCGLCRPGRPPSKIKREKRNKYVDLTRELKNLWNMKVIVIPIVIGALGTIPKGLEEWEIRGQVEKIQTTALLRSARILRRVLQTWGDFLSLKFQRETIS